MDKVLIKLKSAIEEKLIHRKITVEVFSKNNKRNPSLSEIKLIGHTKEGYKADCRIVFYSDTMVAKFAEGNTDVCEWIMEQFLPKATL
ncbi:MAG: hypothetical protein IPO04_10695 [Cytophagaceae bacterium]|nr:hypothetical protein [Cytophagaceae bacterium]